MKKPLFVIILATLAFSTAGHCASPPPLDFTKAVGVNIHQNQLKKGDFARIHGAGFTFVRFDVTWNSIEQQPGVYNFAPFDNLVAQITGNKLKAIAILGYGNSLYNTKDPASYNTAKFRNAYAAFCAATIAHYAGKGFLWEMWNEPNNPGAWPLGSSAYIAMIKQASQEVRKNSPNEFIVGPACSQIKLPFIEDCLKGGMLDYWSGLTVHPYRQIAPESVASEYAALNALIARYTKDGRPIPIICGEWGYSTAWKGMTEAIQSDYLRRIVLIDRKENIPLTILYDWRDNGDDSTDAEHRFGIVRRNAEGLFKPKPSFWSVKASITIKVGDPAPVSGDPAPVSGVLAPVSTAHPKAILAPK